MCVIQHFAYPNLYKFVPSDFTKTYHSVYSPLILTPFQNECHFSQKNLFQNEYHYIILIQF